ncbi:MAG: PQQ-binding-like beta-propeller repeat protein [Deltaproteobacteria bacterium]|nr:PQQ-binding-like beta-propeller repeat protein [Deltaproteobacteria bacterium]
MPTRPRAERNSRGRARRRRTLLALGALLGAFAPNPASAGDWPHWRGPGFDGRVPANDALPRGPITLTRSWARPLGVGYAGIATSGALVVTMYGDGREDHVVALDAASGETRWRRAIGPMFPAGGGSEGGPKSTPTIDGDTVYALGPNGDLLALALADGAERWRIQLVSDVGAVRPEFGFATSPLVIGERLVVATGGPSGHGITALDKASGAALWSAGDDPLEYPSPIPATLAGVEQVVAVSDGAALGLDPATGAVLWRFPHELHEVPTAVLLGDDRVLVPGVEEDARAAGPAERERARGREALGVARLQGQHGQPRPARGPPLRFQRRVPDRGVARRRPHRVEVASAGRRRPDRDRRAARDPGARRCAGDRRGEPDGLSRRGTGRGARALELHLPGVCRWAALRPRHAGDRGGDRRRGGRGRSDRSAAAARGLPDAAARIRAALALRLEGAVEDSPWTCAHGAVIDVRGGCPVPWLRRSRSGSAVKARPGRRSPSASRSSPARTARRRTRPAAPTRSTRASIAGRSA